MPMVRAREIAGILNKQLRKDLSPEPRNLFCVPHRDQSGCCDKKDKIVRYGLKKYSFFAPRPYQKFSLLTYNKFRVT